MYNSSNETNFYSQLEIVGIRARPCFAEADDIKYRTHLSAILAVSIVIIALSPVALVGNAVILTAIWKETFERTWFHVLLSQVWRSVIFLLDSLSNHLPVPDFCCWLAVFVKLAPKKLRLYFS